MAHNTPNWLTSLIVKSNSRITCRVQMSNGKICFPDFVSSHSPPSIVSLMNPQQESSRRFLDRIAADLEAGYHFIPFLGAGFSQSAGFPTTAQLASYHLPYWIIRALELNPLAKGKKDLTLRQFARWHPRDGWWPNIGEELLGASERPDNAIFSYARAHELLELAKEKKREENNRANPNPPPSQRVLASMDTIERALALLPKDGPKGWLLLVQFLARLTRRSESPDDLIYASAERQSVVDSLFIYLNECCQTSLAHELIAALVPIWRSRVILTTNFDTLLERAFASIREPLNVFEIPKTAPLPDAHLVLSQVSLLKLHGGRFDVRADISVGALLGREDMKNALGYVAERPLFPDDRIIIPGAKEEKAAIVFFGCGGDDERTNNFAQFVKQHFHKIKIYWISLSPKKPKQVPIFSFFRHEGPDAEAFLYDYQDFGLLLLNLYQHITKTIPTSGSIFPGPWQLLSPPRITEDQTWDEKRREPVSKVVEKIRAAFPSIHAQRSDIEARPILLSLGNNNCGAAVICLPVFNDIQLRRDHGFRCLWIDVDGITMPAGVFSRILMMASRLEGVIDPLTSLDLDGLRVRKGKADFVDTVKRALIDHNASTGLRLVIFLNMTEPPGGSALYALDSDPFKRERWANKKEVSALFETIVSLNRSRACGVQFVVIAPKDRANYAQTFGGDPKRTTSDEVLSEMYDEFSEVLADEKCTPFSPRTSAQAAMDWMAKDPAERELRLSFLVVLLAFRQSRYPAALTRVFETYWDRCPANRLRSSLRKASSLVEGWLDQLESQRVLRFRDGGFVWLNSRVETLLVELLRSDLKTQQIVQEAFPRVRACIARWYGRLLLACADPLAAVEGIYQNVEGVLELAQQSGSPEITVQAEAMIGQAGFLLNTARTLFERRLATNFADRSLAVLCEQASKLLDEKICKANSVMRARMETLADELVTVRATVALLEAQFHVLRERWADPRRLRSKERERRDALSLVRIAASLHLRAYDDAEKDFRQLWKRIVATSLKMPATLLWSVAGVLPVENDRESISSDAARAACQVAFDHELRADNPASRAQLRILAQLSRWGLYLHLNRSHANFVSAMSRCIGNDEKDHIAACRSATERRVENVRKAEWFLHFGLELLRSASDTSDGFIFEESVRLRSHGALVLGILESHQTRTEGASTVQLGAPPKRFARSWTLLRDAESFMGDFPLQDPGANAAILRLRAAELCLLEVHSLDWFQKVRTAIRKLNPPREDMRHELTCFRAENIREELKIRTLPWDGEGCNQVGARVAEALNWLEKAEQSLISHPKSRWWWWIFAVVKMRACEYLYTLRYARGLVGDMEPRKEPRLIPPSGFRFVESGLLRLIHEKDLGDSFYLARVVSSYAEVFRAESLYAVAFRNEPKQPQIDERHGRYRSALMARARTLRVLIKKLERVETPKSREVKLYNRECVKKAKRMLEGWSS